MDWRLYMKQHPGVMTGKPVIKDARLTVELILKRLSDGDSEADLLESYPRLRPEHICAALPFAAALLSSKEMVFSDTKSQ